jgi:hypothetical protein
MAGANGSAGVSLVPSALWPFPLTTGGVARSTCRPVGKLVIVIGQPQHRRPVLPVFHHFGECSHFRGALVPVLRGFVEISHVAPPRDVSIRPGGVPNLLQAGARLVSRPPTLTIAPWSVIIDGTPVA